MAKQQNKEELPQPEVSVQEPCNIIVEVMHTGVRIGNLIFAKGAEAIVTQTQYDVLVADGSVRKLGVQ